MSILVKGVIKYFRVKLYLNSSFFGTLDPGIRTQTTWKKFFPSNLIVLGGSEPIGRPWMSAAKRGCFSKRSKPYM
jgi:hypothetical protein